MTVRNLDFLFRPASVAVVGASDRLGMHRRIRAGDKHQLRRNRDRAQWSDRNPAESLPCSSES